MDVLFKQTYRKEGKERHALLCILIDQLLLPDSGSCTVIRNCLSIGPLPKGVLQMGGGFTNPEQKPGSVFSEAGVGAAWISMDFLTLLSHAQRILSLISPRPHRSKPSAFSLRSFLSQRGFLHIDLSPLKIDFHPLSHILPKINYLVNATVRTIFLHFVFKGIFSTFPDENQSP